LGCEKKTIRENDGRLLTELIIAVPHTTKCSKKVGGRTDVSNNKQPKEESKEGLCQIVQPIRSKPPYRPHDKLTPRNLRGINHDNVILIRAKMHEYWSLVEGTHLEKRKQVYFWSSEKSKVIREWNELFQGIKIPDWSHLDWKEKPRQLYFEIVGNKLPTGLTIFEFYKYPGTNIMDVILARLIASVYCLQSKQSKKPKPDDDWNHLKTIIGYITRYY